MAPAALGEPPALYLFLAQHLHCICVRFPPFLSLNELCLLLLF